MPLRSSPFHRVLLLLGGSILVAGCQAQQGHAASAKAAAPTPAVDQSARERDQYKSQAAMLTQDVEDLKRKNQALQSERDNLAARLATTESTLSQTRGEVQKVHADLDTARASAQRFRQELEAARRNQKLVDDVAARITATEGNLRATEQRNGSLKQELGTTQSRLQEVLEQNRQLRAKLEESKQASRPPATGPSITIKSTARTE